jgi:hypothetical protein
MAVAIAVLVVAVSGVAYATIPGSNGVISGCYSKLTGALRVIDASKQACPKSQVPISWNQTGPQGLPGTPAPTAATARIDTPGIDDGTGDCCAAQRIPSDTEIAVDFPNARFDPDGMHQGGVDNPANTELTAPLAGIYQIDAGVIWPGAAQNASTAGMRQAEIWVDGSAVPAGTNRMANSDDSNNLQNLSTTWELNAGDYVELRVLQTSGTTLSLPLDQRTFLSMTWVAPLP